MKPKDVRYKRGELLENSQVATELPNSPSQELQPWLQGIAWGEYLQQLR